MRARRRTGLKALAALPAGALLAACASTPPAPAGNWTRQSDGPLLVAVPEGWARSTPDDGWWTSRWTDPADASSILSTASRVEDLDAYAALSTASDSLRTTTRGYELTGPVRAWSDGRTLLARADYRTTWPVDGPGSIWAVNDGRRICVVALSGPSITEEQMSTVGSWIELSRSGAEGSPTASAAATDHRHVTAGDLGCDLPASWTETGPLEGSAYWSSTWALVEDDVMVRRVLLAPTLPQTTVREAMDQLLADLEAGNRDGFLTRTVQSLTLTEIGQALRADFVSGEAGATTGCLWVVAQGTRVAAVQYSGAGTMDYTLRNSIEQSITFTP